MKYSIVLIVPHFGKFKSYFPLWLHSCKYNSTIHWLVFTDDQTPYDFPSNVTVYYTTFKEVVQRIQNLFDFKINLKSPYYLCEFKVTYGEAFQDYIKDYDFWGYCDTDLIWGNLREHITDEVLANHNKVSWRGHLTLFRNNRRINGLYKSPVNGLEYFKYALANHTGYIVAFDERIINNIFESNGEQIYTNLRFADLKIRSSTFFLLHFLPQNDYKNRNQIFMWEEGNLFRLYTHNNIIFKESYAYIHFLKRDMAFSKSLNFEYRFLIVPNRFINYADEITVNTINTLSRKKVYWKYLISRFSLQYIKSKLSYHSNKRAFKKEFYFLPVQSYQCKIPTPKHDVMYNESQASLSS